MSWALPGASSIKARVVRHQDLIEFSWLRNEVSKNPPISIEIHPTNRCNLKCKFCSYNDIRAGEYLSKEVFSNLISDLVKCTPRLRSIMFSGGGEPSINPYLPEAINRLVDAGIEVSVITNGTYMNEDLFRAYQRCTWIRFSIDVPWEDTYTRLMSPHKKDNFANVIRNVRSLAEAKDYSKYQFPTLGLGFIVTKDCQSDDSIIRCLDIGKESGADYIMYRPLIDLESEQITRPLSEFKDLIPKVDEYSKKIDITHQFKKFVNEFERTVDRKVPTDHKECPIVQDSITAYVAATGDVVPCYAIYMQDMKPEWSFGNINEKGFLEIWNEKLREQVISNIDATKCPFCRFQGHNKILTKMAANETPDYSKQQEDAHWKFL